MLTNPCCVDLSFVDGPNVAYFGYHHVNYCTLKLVVEKLEAIGERPLVVMPYKYVQPKFHISRTNVQVLSEQDWDVIERYVDMMVLYRMSTSVCV